MLVELGMVQAVVRDVYIPARYGSEESSLSEWKTFFEFPLRLLSSFFRRLVVQHFIRDFDVVSVFILIGGFLSAFGLAFGLYHWYLSYITEAVASTGTVMVATLPLILGAELLIQALVVDIQSVPLRTYSSGN